MEKTIARHVLSHLTFLYLPPLPSPCRLPNAECSVGTKRIGLPRYRRRAQHHQDVHAKKGKLPLMFTFAFVRSIFVVYFRLSCMETFYGLFCKSLSVNLCRRCIKHNGHNIDGKRSSIDIVYIRSIVHRLFLSSSLKHNYS